MSRLAELGTVITRSARAPAAGLLLLLGACGGLSDGSAAALVRAYNAALIQAFRTADPQLMEPAAGPREVRKLTGLIGVKSDLGITLDARLVRLVVEEVVREDQVVLVRTRESWHYADRRVGTGAQVGEASDDRYHMEYRLQRFSRGWRVAAVSFLDEPVVGRKTQPLSAPGSVMHGAVGAPDEGR